jgi:uncharacterized protein (DUF1499 family)
LFRKAMRFIVLHVRVHFYQYVIYMELRYQRAQYSRFDRSLIRCLPHAKSLFLREVTLSPVRQRDGTGKPTDMVRRRIAPQPMSRLAIWARRIALFSLAATFIAVIVVRSGALDIVPALSTLAGGLALAVIAILLAFGAGIVIWREGIGGVRQAITALLIGVALIAYPLYLAVTAYRLPAIYDITTDPIDPPRFEVIARLRPRDAHPVTYAGLYAAEQQRASYSDIEPDLTDSAPLEAYEAALKVITKRKWAIVDARPPQGAGSHEGHIEAIAHTMILGFRDDVAVRVRATADGSRIDVRSASRYGRSDLGTNAARVRDLISDIDDVLAAPQPEKKEQSPPKPTHAAGKGPARR